jgi:hypothetical protein
MTVRPRKRLGGLPDGAQLVIGEYPIAGSLLKLCARHAPPDRRQEVIVSTCVPIEDPGEERQHGLRLMRTVLHLNAVKQPYDLAAFDGVDLSTSHDGQDEALEHVLPRLGGAQLGKLALKVFLGDGPKCGTCGFAPLAERVAAPGNIAEDLFRPLGAPPEGLSHPLGTCGAIAGRRDTGRRKTCGLYR